MMIAAKKKMSWQGDLEFVSVVLDDKDDVVIKKVCYVDRSITIK